MNQWDLDKGQQTAQDNDPWDVGNKWSEPYNHNSLLTGEIAVQERGPPDRDW